MEVGHFYGGIHYPIGLRDGFCRLPHGIALLNKT